MILLREIDEDLFEKCLKLKVEESQQRFVASNTLSLAHAWLYPKNARPFAICEDDTAVGFLMLDADVNCDGTHSVCGLWRLMVDKQHQGKGYGRAALKLLIDHVHKTYNPEKMQTSYVLGNENAAKLYESLGFVHTGEIDDGEAVMELPLREETQALSPIIYKTKKELPQVLLHQLFQAVGWSDKGEITPQMLENFNLPFINSTFVVSAWDGEALVGCIRVLSDKMFRSVIYDLAVLPDYQGKGIGTQLVKRCIKQIPDSEWFVETTQERASYYEQLGFTRKQDVFLTIPANGFKRC